jgi:hypothetical protein
MELEIKGLIEFCKAISSSPTEISKSSQLVEALSFCLEGLGKCDCSNKPNIETYEKKYSEMAAKFSEETIKVLGEIFDPNKSYSSINISFPNNNNKIKVK